MIPKNIFQSWYTINLDPAIQSKIDTFKSLNPNYNHKIYTDEEIDSFVNENYKGEIADCYNRLNIIVAKVDFWRYLVLYKYGGIYIDMDSCINISLDTFIKEEDEAIITSEDNKILYVQWALIFNKNHPILEKTIEMIVQNIKDNKYPNDIHKMTGPYIYTEAINSFHESLFNEKMNQNNIDSNTDITYKKNNISYRIYGIDYNGKFTFKYPESDLLYVNKKPWRTDQAEKQLLKSNENFRNIIYKKKNIITNYVFLSIIIFIMLCSYIFNKMIHIKIILSIKICILLLLVILYIL